MTRPKHGAVLRRSDKSEFPGGRWYFPLGTPSDARFSSSFYDTHEGGDAALIALALPLAGACTTLGYR